MKSEHFKVFLGICLGALGCFRGVESPSGASNVQITAGKKASDVVNASTVRLISRESPTTTGTCSGVWVYRKAQAGLTECVVMSAAHCVTPGLEAERYTVEFVDAAGTVLTSYTASEVFANPSFVRTEGDKMHEDLVPYDGALIRFNCNPPPAFKPVRIVSPQFPLSNEILILAGFGLTKTDVSGSRSPMALQVPGVVARMESFPPRDKSNLPLTARNMSFTTRAVGGEGTCQGDSGGPSYLTDAQGVLWLAGTLSGNSVVCERGRGYYSLAAGHLIWAEKVLGYALPSGIPQLPKKSPENRTVVAQPPTVANPVIIDGAERPPGNPMTPPTQMDPIVRPPPVAGEVAAPANPAPQVSDPQPTTSAECAGLIFTNSAGAATHLKLVDADSRDITDSSQLCPVFPGPAHSICLENDIVRSTLTGNSRGRLMQGVAGCGKFTAGTTVWLFRPHFDETGSL